MSTLAQLKTVVFAYLQTNFPSVTRHALLTNGTPATFDDLLDTLFVQAADNARKHAEQKHDFQAAECTLTGVIPTTGLGLSWDAMLDEDDVVQSLRSIEAAYVQNETDGNLVEVAVKRKRFLTKLKFDQRMRRTRYHEHESPPSIFQHKRKFYCDPLNDVDIGFVVDGYMWLPNYSILPVIQNIVTVSGTLVPNAIGEYVEQPLLQYGFPWYKLGNIIFVDGLPAPLDSNPSGVIFNSGGFWNLAYYPTGDATIEVSSWSSGTGGATPDIATDWSPTLSETGTPVFVLSQETNTPDLSTITDYFLTHGFSYMQWATIVELNHLIQRFVPRQEGGLNPPTRERDIQLELLIVNDSFASESGDYHDVRND